MKKMRLEVEALVVESLVTGGASGTGTVRGFDSTEATMCSACDGAGTGEAYCADNTMRCPDNTNYTCGESCRCSEGVTWCNNPSCWITCPGVGQTCSNTCACGPTVYNTCYTYQGTCPGTC